MKDTLKDLIKDKQLWLIVILCSFILLIYFKTSDDPVHPILVGTVLESCFLKFETGNNLIKDVFMGILVSTIFWFFNIYLPEKKDNKRKVIRLNKALKLVLESFGAEAGPHHWDKHYAHCAPLAEDDMSLIVRVKNMLDDKKIFGTFGEKYFYEICHESSQLYYFLSISASELSPKHGELWDSITRSVRRIADIYPEWCRCQKNSGFEAGVDYSEGVLWTNLTEFLESLEKWIELNK